MSKMSFSLLLYSLFYICFQAGTEALDNGLALTPPMGWLSWERFRCIVDCQEFPDDCISEKLFTEIADSIVSEGYSTAGYEYVIIDDCWLSKQRDENGNLQADPDRFPNGIKALADYIHSKGLKFGIYEDYGTYTCGGYPGILGHLEQDANLLASWGIDYIKIDGCYADVLEMNTGYPEFGYYLNKTNRPIVYSCSWPVYQEYSSIAPNFEELKKTCNLWRNYGDIQDSWGTVRNIMDYFANKQEIVAQHAGPGHWNDPDMLIIGNYGLSIEQSKAQMAIWCILAAPLILSNDVRNTRLEFREILLNKDAIAIDQDRLGIQGRRVYLENKIEVWTKPVEPVNDNGDYSYGVAVLSRREDGSPYVVTISLKRIGLLSTGGYNFTEIFQESQQFVEAGGSIKLHVPPTGVRFFKATVLPTSQFVY